MIAQMQTTSMAGARRAPTLAAPRPRRNATVKVQAVAQVPKPEVAKVLALLLVIVCLRAAQAMVIRMVANHMQLCSSSMWMSKQCLAGSAV